jgi:DNA-binding Lrp family transcriptional regulator
MQASKAMQGTFTRENLPDLMQYLAVSARDGQLTLKTAGLDAASAVLTFRNGALWAAVSPEAQAEKVLYQVLRWTGGSFDFERTSSVQVNPNERIHRSFDSLLLEVFQRTQPTLPEGKPDPDLVPRIAAINGNASYQLTGRQLQIICQVDGHRSLQEISNKLGLDPRETQRQLEQLESLQLVVLERFVTVLPERFIHELQNGLTRIVGPLADVLIEDLLGQVGWNATALQADQALKLMTALEREVNPDQINLVRNLRSQLIQKFKIQA